MKKTINKFLAFVLALALATGIFALAPTSARAYDYQTGMYLVTYGGILYAEPDTESEAIAEIPEGTPFVVAAYSGDFAVVTYGDLTGYLDVWDIEYLSDQTSYEPGKYTVYNELWDEVPLPLYLETDISSQKLKMIPYETEITVISTSGAFGMVSYDGALGWVILGFLAPVDEPETDTDTSSSDTSDTDTATYTEGLYTVSAEGAIMRSGYEEYYSISCVIPNKTVLYLSDFNEGWGYATYKKAAGWIKMSELTEGGKFSAEILSFADAPIGLYKTPDLGSETVAMYSKPSTASEKAGHITSLELLDVCMIDGEFGYTTFKSYRGYVKLSELELVESYEYGEIGTYRITADEDLELQAYTTDELYNEAGYTLENGDICTVYLVYFGSGMIKTEDGRWLWVDLEELLLNSVSYAGMYKVMNRSGADVFASLDSTEAIENIRYGKKVLVAYFEDGKARIFDETEKWVDAQDLKIVSPQADIADIDDSWVYSEQDTDSQLPSDTDSDPDTATDSDHPTDTDTSDTDSEPQKPIKTGDADGNSDVNMKDVTLIQRIVAKLTSFPSQQTEKAADVNGDDKVNMLDVTTIQRFIAKLITSFPVDAQNK